MNKTEIEKMATMENSYWWHIGKKHLVKTYLETNFKNKKNLNILEIGCGAGNITQMLTEYGNVTAFDISQDAIDYCKEKGLKNVHLVNVETFDHSTYKNKFDIVFALDVLEHIQDDLLTMKKVYEMLKKNGQFFVNVPAHKFLWSEHDEALEHKRRYHRVELLGKLQDTGFDIASNSYFVCLISPIIVTYRIWGNIFGKSAYPKTSYVLLPNKVNNILVKLLEIETSLISKIRIPFGVTLNVVAIKSKK